ncbi:MAG: hypothetical protein J6S00_05665, partial [Clostridia bacterium]|nr:hypothetical protein [Clostridia bacterium]
ALDLINRLQAENESKQELIERLQNANVQALRGTINVSKNIAKAEAYKEFAERLKEDISNHRTEMYMNGLKGTPRTREITYECVEEYIDNLLKELVGE